MYKELIRRVVPARIWQPLLILARAVRLPSDQLARVAAGGPGGMQGEPFRFYEDGLATIHTCEFLSDSRFEKAYALGHATGSWGTWSPRWRAYVVCWCAQWASRLPGDFVECGVNRGGNARMILDYIPFSELNKRFLLFDTFRGFVVDQVLPEERELAAKFLYPDCLDDVKKTFKPFPCISIIPGIIPESLAQDDTDRVAFLSLDMNCAQPEIDAAEHFWPKMTPGGVMVLDDYGFSAHGAQRAAFNRFAADRGVAVLTLPTGQGLIFKPMS